MTTLDSRIAGLSPERRAYLEQLLRAKNAKSEPKARLEARPRHPGAPLPCSFAQQRLFFLDRLEPGSPAYVVVSAARLPASFEADLVERALAEIVRRHEILRTTFLEIDGVPMQVVADPERTTFRLERLDLRGLTPARADAEVRRLGIAEAERPFDLRQPPLLRATFVRVPRANALLLALHHIVTDGWSMSVLYRELLALYDAFAGGQASPLAPLPLQYADFALWQREVLSADVLGSHLAYWRERLADAPRLELPTDRPRPARRSFRGGSLRWRLPRAIDERLRELSRREGATLFMTLLAGFAALLARLTGSRDVVVGTPTANRDRAELEGLIGFFVNTLVLRIDASGAPTFRQLVGRVRAAALGAYSHQDLPFERLVEELQPRRDLGRNPIFDVLFHLQSSLSRREVGPRDEDHLSIERTTTIFDLAFDLFEAPDEVEGTVDYSTDLFDHATVARLTGSYETLLAAAAADPDRPIDGLPLLREAERHELLVEWNATSRPIPATRLHTLFEAQAARTPDAAAVRAHDADLAFAQLNRRANRLAHHLRAHGAGAGSLVAVCLERSAALIVAILGVLKSGAAYLPVDPAAPPARRAAILADARVQQVVDGEALAQAAGEIAAEPDHDPQAPGAPADLAYVIYTSGSTGLPKGVEVEHRSVVHLWTALRERVYGVEAAPLRVSLNGSVAVDTSVKQLVQLLSGHCLVVVDDAVRSDPRALVRFLRQERVDVLDSSPSQLRLLADEGLLDEGSPEGSPPAMLLVGGEAIDDATWQRLGAHPHVACWNLYGPTECTVDATAGRIESGETPTIGGLLPNTLAYVLDARGEPLPVGVPGELYLGGAGVARGYRGAAAATAEKFVPNPFGAGRLYRTGDRARWRPGATLEFLGRVDDQIKVRGHRIEPREIEAALTRHPAVADARVLLVEGMLVGYLVSTNGPEPVAPDALWRFLREHLPEAMVPAAYVWLARFPLTPGGKLDRAALPRPDLGRGANARASAPPRTADERAMAALWEGLLGVQGIGVHDDFFAELGGHSLVAMRVVARLRDLFGAELPLRRIFETPTIAGLLAALEEARRAPAGPRLPELVPAPRELYRATFTADGRLQLPPALQQLLRPRD